MKPKTNDNMKIVVLGATGVGKTCLLNRYTRDIFTSVPMTSSAYYKSHRVLSQDKKIDIDLSIWDTAGQEMYKSMSFFYCRNADAVILVYDITNIESFEELPSWLDEINNVCSKDVILTIAGNKCDLLKEEKVDSIEAEKFAKINNANFFLVSAKSDINVTKLYTDLCYRKFPTLTDTFDELYASVVHTEGSDVNKGMVLTVNKKLSRRKDICC